MRGWRTRVNGTGNGQLVRTRPYRSLLSRQSYRAETCRYRGEANVSSYIHMSTSWLTKTPGMMATTAVT